MRKIIVALVFWGALSAAFAAEPKPIGWTILYPSNAPPGLSHSGFAYDSNANRGVVFGGITKGVWSNETWIWTGDDWLRADPPTSPPAREKTAMAFDPERNTIVLFGGASNGSVFDDTWEWKDDIWQVVNPVHRPPARCCHAMAYDNVRRQVLLYGGWSPLTGEFFRDTWEWDGKDWTDVTCCNAAFASAHAIASFSAQNEIIAFHSIGDGTWAWDGDGWHDLGIENPYRQDGRLGYDSDYKRLVLFGGIRDGELLNDTWIFDGQKWMPIDLPTSPPARYGHVMFYDQKRRSIILFGGAGEEGVLQDTWELNLPEDCSSYVATPAPPPLGQTIGSPPA